VAQHAVNADTVSAADFVYLRGGLTLPLTVLRLAWDLEERGVVLQHVGDALLVAPRNALTDGDRALIRRWRLHLLALLEYDADAVQH
jgi:hypothetical protein